MSVPSHVQIIKEAEALRQAHIRQFFAALGRALRVRRARPAETAA